MRFDSRGRRRAYSDHSLGLFLGRAARGSAFPRKAACQPGERRTYLVQGRQRAQSTDTQLISRATNRRPRPLMQRACRVLFGFRLVSP